MLRETIRYSELRPDARSAVPRVRWYRAYRGHGSAADVVDRLAAYIRQRRIADTVCAVRVEKRPKREFYFFLALDTERFGELPSEVEEHLAECPLLRLPFPDPCELEEIKGMVSGEVQLKAIGHCISYRQLKLDAADDPFRSPEARTALGGNGEALLWYLSSLGAGSWATFQSVVNALGFSETGSATRAARSLRLLGHLETDSRAERWSVTPPAVIATGTPGGTTTSYRTGARRTGIDGPRTPQAWGPDRLEATCDEVDLENPASAVVTALPDLDGFATALPQIGGVSALNEIRVYDGTAFVPAKFGGDPGMYELEAAHGRRVAAFFDGEKWRYGDWYGLRFLSLAKARALLPARHEALTWRLVMPADQRPPELFERPLVLSSGLLPVKDGAWYVYDNVSPDVAKEVCERLGVNLVTGP